MPQAQRGASDILMLEIVDEALVLFLGHLLPVTTVIACKR